MEKPRPPMKGIFLPQVNTTQAAEIKSKVTITLNHKMWTISKMSSILKEQEKVE